MADDPQLIGGRYRLVKRLAAGGMGAVWEGWDERLHRTVAIKQLHPQPGPSDDTDLANSRAMREARITARLHHPNAVPVYDVIDSDGRPCLIMQFLPSISLQQLVRDTGVVPVAEVARIGAEIASALAAAHRAGIVHRDIKPGNVLIAEDGTAKITDFGISHALGDVSLTSTGMLTGTPAYLAPEIARGANSGAASDVFSLGATLYFAIEGIPPFGEADPNPMAVLHKVASGRMIPPRRSAGLTPLLLEMLAADPGARPPMDVVAARLAAPLPGSRDATAPIPAPATVPVVASTPPTDSAQTTAFGPPRAAEPGRRRPGVIAVVAALVVVALGAVAGVLLLTSNNGNPGGATTSGQTAGAGPTTRSSVRSSPLRSPSSRASTSTRASRTSAATSTSASTRTSAATSTSASHSASTPPTAPTAAELSRGLTTYYGVLPANTDAGWNRLTPRYQQSHVGGRGAYNRFWGSIDRVDVSQVAASAPASVTATITYHFHDGRVVDESTSFTLVRRAGVLKIDSSNVLSSTQR